MLLFLIALGCRTKDENDSGLIDSDLDGFSVETDCDDADAEIHPDADEVCDDRDNDCDDAIDEGVLTTFYADVDLDGYGDANDASEGCTAPSGYVDNDEDCNDLDAATRPDAAEDDCTDPTDYNCDGSVGYADADGDGHAACEDCDDTNAARNPDASETCNDLDDDCNGSVDDDASDAETWYADSDGDGYGDADRSGESCERPFGYVDNDTDCDDNEPKTNPGSYEICDSVDNDCDGDTDEDDAINATTWYADTDSDGYGDSDDRSEACDAPTGYVDNDDDCDDSDSDVSPADTELCDEIDNDCDGDTDEDDAADATSWYADSDSDGYGDSSDSELSCDQPGGYVDNDDDCDDSDDDINPSEEEVCDSADNDCDGDTDEDDASDASTWYEDDDGDGYGNPDSTQTACDAPSGYTEDDTDCLDDDASIYPGEGCEADCQELYDAGWTSTGEYLIDPDGPDSGNDAIDVYCDHDEDGGGWTLCASLTKGYAPMYALHDMDLYAFQARKNSDDDYVYDTDAPARTTATWDASEDQNHGQFCRLMGTGVTETWVVWKTWNYENNYGSALKDSAYDLEKEGVYSGNLFLQWFTDSSSARTFTKISGDDLTVVSDDNGYGQSWTTPTVSWSGGALQYTHSINPWGYSSYGDCSGCTYHSAGYTTLPYGETTILNDLTHSFWSGMTDPGWGWSDCTADGNCDYHESGYGVWLFYVR